MARLSGITSVFRAQYSREDETSKAKPIAQSHGLKEIVGAYFFGLLPLILLSFLNFKFAFVLVPLFCLYYFSKRYYQKWIDGYTGDCLGATEQMAECIILLTYLALWKFM